MVRVHPLKNVYQSLFLFLTTNANLFNLMIVLGRVDFRRENALLLLLSLEVDYIRQTLSLEFADKSLAIFQQTCLIKDHIIATWDEVDC